MVKYSNCMEWIVLPELDIINLLKQLLCLSRTAGMVGMPSYTAR